MIDSDASSLLEAALKQMDGIIISNNTNQDSNLPDELNREFIDSNVLSTSRTLALALQQVGIFLAPPPDISMGNIIYTWLQTHLSDKSDVAQNFKSEIESLSNNYKQLQEKSLKQQDRIEFLEKLLTDKTQRLNSVEDLLQKSELSKSYIETQRLECLSALSEAKLQKTSLEHENIELKNDLANSYELLKNNVNIAIPKTPPASFRFQISNKQGTYHSLPRQVISNSPKKNLILPNNSSQTVDKPLKSVVFSESSNIHNSDEARHIFPEKEKSKGLRNIFDKLRRCNSGNLEDLLSADKDFQRGGTRATTNGRLQSHKYQDISLKSYRLWNLDDICEWLSEMGMDEYIPVCRKWLESINHHDFFTMAPTDFESSLNFKHILHKKKLMLAINELTGKENDEMFINAGQMNSAWVIRWLDDIGLPQYKDNFFQAKVDGRMLHKLTMEDLVSLQVLSCLHITSIRRAIQILREIKWNDSCFLRRSKSNGSEIESEPIKLWTAHRVMEWLRAVDLAEYAPNLRGAGVHGALMYFENKFNADLLADLLSIPVSKTLLRRHLATHFKDLLGRDIISQKRDIENQADNQPLTLSSKIKLPKKTQFSLKRKKSIKGSDIEWSDYVCPF